MTPTSNSLQFGLSLRHALQAQPGKLRDLARAAEDEGFHSLWAPHHTIVPTEYESRYPYQPDSRLPFPADTMYSDALTLLAHIAAVTSRVRLGTGIIPLTTQHPLSLAKQAATVDHLSDGRLDLGIGAGWLVEEAVVLGQATDRRARRLNEAIDIMRQAWTGQPFTHRGEFWGFPELISSPAAPQGRDLPILIGGGGPAAIETMRTRASGAILPPGAAGERMLPELRSALPPDRRLVATLAVAADTPEEDILSWLRALSDRGVSTVIVNSTPDVEVAIALVRRLGKRVLPHVPTRAPRASDE